MSIGLSFYSLTYLTYLAILAQSEAKAKLDFSCRRRGSFDQHTANENHNSSSFRFLLLSTSLSFLCAKFFKALPEPW